MSGDKTQSVGNIRNSVEFKSALAEANADSILVTLLKISEQQGRTHLNRSVQHILHTQELMTRQDEKNARTVAAKQENSKTLDFLSTAFSFMSGLAGGPMAQLGATLQAVGQGFQSVSSMEGQKQQGKVTKEEHEYRRLDSLMSSQTQGSQGADRDGGDCRQSAKTALDVFDSVVGKIFAVN